MYNEEASILSLLKRLVPVLRGIESLHGEMQLVTVDDGSSDKTSEFLETYFSGLPGVEVDNIRHLRNQGIGGAMRTGFEAAKGDIVCTLDCDCTYSPEELPFLIDLLLRSGADIATGSPYHPNGAVENVKAWRLALSKSASRMYSWITPTRLHCYTSFFRAYRREWANPNSFQSSGFMAVAEILVEASRRGARIIEYPTRLGQRMAGESKMRVAKTTLDHAGFMVRTVLDEAKISSESAKRPGGPPEDDNPEIAPDLLRPIHENWKVVERIEPESENPDSPSED
jgi:dolichol-phosphate mannosyltransferase